MEPNNIVGTLLIVAGIFEFGRRFGRNQLRAELMPWIEELKKESSK